MEQILPQIFTFTGLIAGRVYMLQDADGLTLIDASIANAGNKILAQLKAAGHEPSAVKRILITHGHPDHVGSLPQLRAVTGAEVWAHPLEKPVIQGEQSVVRRPSGFRPPDTKVKPTTVDKTFGDQDMLPVLGGLQVIHTPGHAPGHVSFWHPANKLLITGDVIFYLMNKMTLPLAFLTADMDENKRSIKKVLALKPETVLFGHGQPIVKTAAAPLQEFAQRVGVA